MNNNSKCSFPYSIAALIGFLIFAGAGYASEPANLASTSISASNGTDNNNSQFIPGPIVLTKSNHNLLSVNRHIASGYLYVYNNSDKPANFKIDPNTVPKSIAIDEAASDCAGPSKIEPYKECRFKISYQGGSGSSAIPLHIISTDTSGDDWFTVKVIDVPLGAFYRPDVDGTAAHSMPAFTSMAAIKKGSFTISYAGSFYGIYKSTDHGETWAPESDGLSSGQLKINDILSVDGDLYAGTYAGVVKWDNTKRQWAEVGSKSSLKDDPSSSPQQVQKLLSFDKKLFAGVQQDNSSSSLYDDICIYQLELDASSPTWTKSCDQSKFYKQSTDMVTGLVYFDNHKLLISTNNDGIRAFDTNQKTWEHLNDGLPGLAMCSLASYDKNLYAGHEGGGYEGGGVYKWNNERQSWQAENKGLEDGVIEYNLSNPLLLATDNGLYVSLSSQPHGTPRDPIYGVYKLNADTWVPVAEGLPSPLNPYSFATDNDYLYLYIRNHGFLYKSDIQSIKWQLMSTLSHGGYKGAGEIGIHTILNNPATNELFISTDGGVLKSNDQGANWFYQSWYKDPTVSSVSSLLLVPNVNKPFSYAADVLYAGTGTGVFLWECDQASKQCQWKLVGGSSKQYHKVNSLTYFDSTLYLGADDGVYSFNRNTDSWDKIGNVGSTSSILPFNNTLYAGTASGLFQWIGNQWEKIGKGDETFTTLFSDGNDLYAGTAKKILEKAGNGKVFVLGVDQEKHEKLIDISSGLPQGEGDNTQKVTALAAIDGVLYAGTEGLVDTQDYHKYGDVYSKNGANSDWIKYTTEFRYSNVLSLSAIGKELYVGVDADLYVAQVKE